MSIFIPIQIKIVLQKVQFPPKFKIKSLGDPRKTFENKKVLPVLFVREEDALSLIIDTVRLYSHIDIYILYIVSTVSQSNVHNRFTGDPTTRCGLIESL